MKARLMAHKQLPGRWIDGWLARQRYKMDDLTI